MRKFFKTQLPALGVQPDYVDYMMGHRVDVYHDIPSRIESLRSAYAAADLSLVPKSQLSKLDMLKTFARSLGIDPEKVISEKRMPNPTALWLWPSRRMKSR
jgi:hypothetical protein